MGPQNNKRLKTLFVLHATFGKSDKAMDRSAFQYEQSSISKSRGLRKHNGNVDTSSSLALQIKHKQLEVSEYSG